MTADPSTVEDRKARAAAWFQELRDRICAAFEMLEDELTGTHADLPPAGSSARAGLGRIMEAARAAAAPCR